MSDKKILVGHVSDLDANLRRPRPMKIAPSARLRRFAQEARRLAMECVDGTEPPMCTGTFFAGDGLACSLGLLFRRALRFGPNTPDGDLEDAFFALPLDRNVVVDANDNHPEGLPWALLALADAIEDASKTQKSIP